MTGEYADLSDEELVERCMQRKRACEADYNAACEALFDRCRYYASDSSYLRTNVGSAEARDILAHEVATNVVMRVDQCKYSRKKPLEAYVRKAAKLRTISWLLKAGKKPEGFGDADGPIDDAQDGIGNLIREENDAEIRRKVKKTLDVLSLKYKLVLLLRYYLDMKAKELAPMLDLEEKPVNDRVRRARDQFRDVWNSGDGPAPADSEGV